MSEIWGTSTWNTTTCLLAQFKKRTTHLYIPGKVYHLYQHVVKTCPFCNSTKPRPDRSRVSGLRAEECGDLIFLDHGSTQNWRQNLRISDYLGWSDITFDCNQKSFPKFVNGWTLSRWIRRRFVQKRLSIVLMTCRHSIECIMWRDFQLDRTHLGQIELRWVYDCSRSFSLRMWIQPLKFWTRPLYRRSHLLSWCAKQQQWETHR